MTQSPSLPAIPSSVRALMAELGPAWGKDVSGNVRRMIDAFTPVLAQAPRENIETARAIQYGKHSRQVLDVYRPSGARNAPVVLFAHGGAFVDGDRDRSPQIYSNVLYYFARHGMVGINMEYRLAPEFRYPSGTQDVALALAWARSHIGDHGGDPSSIFLMGHSAGAAHTGSYAYDSSFHGPQGPGIAGHIVVSGRVRAETWPGNPNARKVEAYYGENPGAVEKYSAVSHVSAGSVPTMIAIGGFENPFIDVHCAELFHRLAHAKGRAPRFLRLADHNHTSMIAHLNTADERLGLEIVDFIRSAS